MTGRTYAGSRNSATIHADLSRVRAFILDLDGVLTDTASTHRRAWKRMFDEFLHEKRGGGAEPFSDGDYRRNVDGKPRYDGARSFLESRDIALPFGAPDDPPDRETVCGLGNRKNQYYHELLEAEGVDRIDAAIDWARQGRERGLALAVVTSSRNGRHVLSAAGIADLFDARVDGEDGQALGIPGKPHPAYFTEAARRLGVDPADAAVVEDAASGVEAGVRGGFGLVVGVAGQEDEKERLGAAGADLVVGSLAELPLPGGQRQRRIRELPLLLEEPTALEALLACPRPALFLDYDGTLSPIVGNPAEARLPEATHAALVRARELYPLAIISGRDLHVLHEFVGIDGLYYAGSHGLHVREPDGSEHERAKEFLPMLDRAESRLRDRLEAVTGAEVERKRFAIAVHYRRAARDRAGEAVAAAREVAAEEPKLKTSGGKKVIELRPDLDWDKGSAVRWILELLERSERRLRPIYVGDDATDEDAFEALPQRGLALVVRGEDDDRKTAASLALEDPGQVRDLILQLAERLESEGRSA